MMETNHNESLPVLGKPELVRGKAYIIHEKAIVGQCYAVVCPVCGKQLIINPDKATAHIEVCSQCKAQIGYNAKNVAVAGWNADSEADALPTEINRRMSRKGGADNGGRLVWGFLGRHSANLCEGQNIIGRKDRDAPSDISFDDDYMSRRSISIDVKKKANMSGYTFKLTVLRAANPVIVNSHELYTGNSIYINYGDAIKLGNTVLTFKASKKS